MKTEIKLNHAENLIVEQHREHTTLTMKSITSTSAITLTSEQLDDFIQTLELARDAWKRRSKRGP